MITVLVWIHINEVGFVVHHPLSPTYGRISVCKTPPVYISLASFFYTEKHFLCQGINAVYRGGGQSLFVIFGKIETGIAQLTAIYFVAYQQYDIFATSGNGFDRFSISTAFRHLVSLVVEDNIAETGAKINPVIGVVKRYGINLFPSRLCQHLQSRKILYPPVVIDEIDVAIGIGYQKIFSCRII